MLYASQEKENRDRFKGERYSSRLLCYPLAGGELCNAGSEILYNITVIKCDCKKFYGIVS